MNTLSNQEYIQVQYKDSRNLSARIDLHARFSTDEYPWFHWVFDRFDIPEKARVLELGCGTGLLWRENLERIPPDGTSRFPTFPRGWCRKQRKTYYTPVRISRSRMLMPSRSPMTGTASTLLSPTTCYITFQFDREIQLKGAFRISTETGIFKTVKAS